MMGVSHNGALLVSLVVPAGRAGRPRPVVLAAAASVAPRAAAGCGHSADCMDCGDGTVGCGDPLRRLDLMGCDDSVDYGHRVGCGD